jgi:hypothetical protein
LTEPTVEEKSTATKRSFSIIAAFNETTYLSSLTSINRTSVTVMDLTTIPSQSCTVEATITNTSTAQLIKKPYLVNKRKYNRKSDSSNILSTASLITTLKVTTGQSTKKSKETTSTPILTSTMSRKINSDKTSSSTVPATISKLPFLRRLVKKNVGYKVVKAVGVPATTYKQLRMIDNSTERCRKDCINKKECFLLTFSESDKTCRFYSASNPSQFIFLMEKNTTETSSFAEDTFWKKRITGFETICFFVFCYHLFTIIKKLKRVSCSARSEG